MTKREKIIAAVFLVLVLALFAGAYTLRQRGQQNTGSGQTSQSDGSSGITEDSGNAASQENTNPQAGSQDPITETAFKLNTVVTISIYDSRDTSLLEGCMELCDHYEQMFSRTLETSELYQLNHGELADADGVSHLSAELAELIGRGLEYGQLSGGRFDIAIGPVSSLWDFTSDNPSVPEDSLIQAALPLVDYQDVTLDGQDLTFQKEGMQLDLGAIAKGYIADRLKDYLLENGVESAIINLGGNVLCVGSRPDGTPFRVGLQRPFADRNETIATIEVSDLSVVSSGIYERYFEQDGRLYHHILDPATGYPCENNLVAVTILSEESTDGDGLSTTCFALGLEEGMELIESLENVEAMFITEDNALHYSSGFPRGD